MSESTGQATGGRQIINSHVNVQNLMDLNQQENRDLVVDTLDSIAGLLKPHCGPHSQYGMIITDSTTTRGGFVAPDTFTKDGIKLLESIEFVSLIQSYIKNKITYIGREVDRRAKDGTTTAMILSSLFLRYCMADKDKIRNLNLTTSDQDSLYRALIKLIDEEMQEHAYSLDKFMDLYPGKDEQYWAGVIAFMQSMSSSGGNIELSRCMREIFGQITKDSWEIQTWFTSHLESDVQYSVDKAEYDYSFQINMQTMNVYNSVMRTEWDVENPFVLVIPDIIAPQGVVYKNLIAYLDTFADDIPLCVVVQGSCAELIQHVNKLNAVRKEPIALMDFLTREKQFANTNLDLSVLCAMASIVPYTGKECDNLLTDQYTFCVDRIRSYGSEVQFFGIFDHDNTVTTLHPNYVDPLKFPPYTEILKELRRYADLSNSRINKDQQVYDKAISLIRKMTCVHLPTLLLGGTTHDIIANQLVAQDVVGATMASITNSFFINGTLSMSDVLAQVKNKILKEEYIKADYEKEFMLYILSNLSKAMDEIISILYFKNKHDNNNTMVLKTPICKSGEYVNALGVNVTSDIDMFVGYMEVEEDDMALFDYPIVQPITIYQEILTRVGELLIKLMATDKIIVPGGAFLNVGRAV